ncbi:MFS transporter [Nitratireductor sp. CAU 1489]|uniref:MFS transporter n=1 Tax=Nitratireductor arenosus TaxID=2682096 RepID=A0A844QEV9_9HYPH|nr:MFS transporter [Nitratireductor arenosus]MVA96618.1 MFS transporter [Nitratireductor arenosus]
MPNVKEHGKATRREWAGLAVIALPCLLYSMDLTVLNLAVPHITADLKPSALQLLWIVDIYGFMVAGALVTMGTLGDRIGRRRLLMIGAVAFGLASVVAAFASTAAMLIFARALLGLAAATLAPSTLSLISNMFRDEKQRRVAIGVWIASFSAGAAIGPVVGGVLLTWFWWGSVFLVAVPVMVLLLVLGPLLLPEYRDEDAGRIDLVSAALSIIAVLSAIFALKKFAESGISAETVLALAAGIVIGVIFLVRQRRLTNPLIDLTLFRQSAFGAALSVNVLGFFVAFGSFLLIAQYLQLVLGLSPMAAGLWSVPQAAAFIVGSTITPPLAERIRPGRVMALGLVVAAASFVILSGVMMPVTLPVLVTAGCLMSLGLAPVFTLATDVILGIVPPAKAGAASGLSETSSEFGGALGIAVLGAVATAVYRAQMGGSGLADATLASAGDTLAAALAHAENLAEPMRAELTAAARAAYVAAFHMAAAICTFVVLVAAIVSGTWLDRRQRRSGGGAPATESAVG